MPGAQFDPGRCIGTRRPRGIRSAGAPREWIAHALRHRCLHPDRPYRIHSCGLRVGRDPRGGVRILEQARPVSGDRIGRPFADPTGHAAARKVAQTRGPLLVTSTATELKTPPSSDLANGLSQSPQERPIPSLGERARISL